MKKIFAFLSMMLLMAQFAVAQKNLYILTPEGKLSAYSASKITFDDDLLYFTYYQQTVDQDSIVCRYNVAFKEYKVYKSFAQTPEMGVCFSDVNTNPTIADECVKRNSSEFTQSFTIGALEHGTTYYYRAYVKLNNEVYYGGVLTRTTEGSKDNDYILINGHKFVDLGLPSGTLWATCNVGAVTPAGAGHYFAWGETDMTTKPSYDWDTYAHGTSQYDLTKYNDTDNKTTLDKDDDAACVNWGDSCHIPTSEQFAELIKYTDGYTTWTWAKMKAPDGTSVEGWKVVSKTNGHYIFLPVVGYYYAGLLCDNGKYGHYWMNSCNSEKRYNADFLKIYYTDLEGPMNLGHVPGTIGRYMGNSIRPVANR